MITLLSVASAFNLLDSDWSWQNHPIEHPLYVNTGSFPADFGTEAQLLHAFEAGIEEWNGEGNLQLVSGGSTTLDSYESPGEFVVGYTDEVAHGSVIGSAAMHGYGGSAYDCQIVYYGSNEWGEIDWGFEEETWTTDFAEVTTHEVGHCLGYDHSDDWDSLMRPSTRGYRGLAADDRAAVQAVYPSCTDGDGDGITDCDFDCDDDNAAIHPAAAEICDGVDNNCDGAIDETGVQTLSFGAAASLSANRSDTGWFTLYASSTDTTLLRFRQSVDLPASTRVYFSVTDTVTGERRAVSEVVPAGLGWVESPSLNMPLLSGRTYAVGLGVAGDARYHYDDSLVAVDGIAPVGGHWGGQVADTSTSIHGDSMPTQELVVGTVDLDDDGRTAQCGDCDDRDPSVRPGANEVCDGADNDCDGETDENAPDSDGDGIVDCLDATPNGNPNPDPDPDSGGDGCGSALTLISSLPQWAVLRR